VNCVEKPVLQIALERAGGNQSKAAEMLGITRSTLRKKLLAHGLQP
jgi:Fis family transcriptional regulator